jgi:hypothetical protein
MGIKIYKFVVVFCDKVCITSRRVVNIRAIVSVVIKVVSHTNL